MMKRTVRLLPVVVLGLVRVTFAAEESGAAADLAIRAAGVDRGLCLVIGETDGRLTAAVAKGSRFYVQACARDEGAVLAARQTLVDAGVAHRASLVPREADYLPYADNLINLAVCADLQAEGVSVQEVLRVLAPGGVAVLGNAGGIGAALQKAGVKEHEVLSSPGWVRFVKPVDPGLGTWTQIKGGADQSYVSDDWVVAPWHEIRWIAGPRWGSLYSSYGALVTAGGRVFYKECRTAKGGNQWHLVARDAYNGVELWRIKSGSVWRKSYTITDYTLTCDESQVYLVEDQALVARDARTGRLAKEYAAGFTPTTVTSSGSVLVASGRTRCVALDKTSGKVLWGRPCVTHPAAANGTAYVADGGELEAVELATGKQEWKGAVKILPEKLPQSIDVTVMCKADVVYVVVEERWKPIGQTSAFDAKTGKPLWTRDGKFSHGVLPFENEVWCLSRDSKNKVDNMAALILDHRTGDVKKQFQVAGTVMAKCWGARATTNYVMYSNGWYVDRSTEEPFSDPTTRSPCRLGQHPANGLTYFMPHHCDCKVTLRGFLALSRKGGRQWFADAKEEGEPRLFSADRGRPSGQQTPADWPMYRSDITRSNATDANLAAALKVLWTERLGTGPLTQATAGYGLVYTAEPDSRRVFARDAATGAARWTFVADGRVTHPPTLHQGLCLFGTGAGSVYCLDATSGREVWRLRAAPVQKYIGVEGQFDSPWPVTGNVLVMDGVAYFSTGRSSSQSGGLWLFAVDPATGTVKWRVRGAGSGDLFVSDGKLLRHAGLFYMPADGDRATGVKEVPGILYCTRYLTPVSVADYMATVEPNLAYKKHIELTDGRIRGDCIAFNEQVSLAGWRYTPGTPGWQDQDKTNKFFLHAAGSAKWNLHDIQQHVMGIVVAGERAYVAGRPISYDPEDPSELWVLSTADGRILQTLRLAGTPVYDGLSACAGRLYLGTEDGALTCFAE